MNSTTIKGIDATSYVSPHNDTAQWSTIDNPFVTINDEPEPLDTSNILLIVLFTTNMLVGICGNSLVVFVCGYKLRDKDYKIIKIILILGIFDLVSSFFNPALFVYLIYTRYTTWHFGTLGCKFLKSLGPIATTASCGMVLFMSIDRYRAIVTPTKIQFQTNFVYKTTLFIIFMAFLTHLPYIAFLDTNASGAKCQIYDQDEIFYKIDVSIVLFWDALVLVIFIVSGISIRRALIGTTQNFNRSLTGTQLRNFKRRDKRINRLVFAVSVVFVVCIFPRDFLHIYFKLKTISKQEYTVTKLLLDVNALLKLLSTLNSTLNVFLYAKFNHWFQKELLEILVGKTCFGRFQRSKDLLAVYNHRCSERRPSRAMLIQQNTFDSSM